MQNKIYNAQSVAHLTTPKQLDKYLRVSSPSVWILLAAIVILLAGATVWGVTGKLETTENVVLLSEKGENVIYVRADCLDSLKVGSIIRKGRAEYRVTSITNEEPFQAGDLPNRVLAAGGYTNDMWLYRVTLDGDAVDGVYTADAVLDSRSPISFLLNTEDDA